MEKEYTHGRMAKFTMVSGTKVSNKVLAFGKEKTVKAI
jgi:hypothetical protein